MSTRSFIGRKIEGDGNGYGVEGVYHHWDGYPTGLGATLFGLYRGHFKRDLKAMLKFIVDDHPAGWSTLNDTDLNLPAGYIGLGTPESKCRECGKPMNDRIHSFLSKSKKHHHFRSPANPICFCHGQRSEEPFEVTLKNASGVGCEWGYAFEETHDGQALMHILRSYCGPGKFEGQTMVGAWGMGDETATWKCVATVILDRDEPDWGRLENEVRDADKEVANA